jgi:hypothetical protein
LSKLNDNARKLIPVFAGQNSSRLAFADSRDGDFGTVLPDNPDGGAFF